MAYYNGDGVAKDRLKASQWLDVAVRQNFSEAQYTLGLMLVEGDGIDKSTNRGLSLLEQAAAQGHKLAINYLKKRNGELTTSRPSRGKTSIDPSLDDAIDEKILQKPESIILELVWIRITKKPTNYFFL